jgi:hypothetical protein
VPFVVNGFNGASNETEENKAEFPILARPVRKGGIPQNAHPYARRPVARTRRPNQFRCHKLSSLPFCGYIRTPEVLQTKNIRRPLFGVPAASTFPKWDIPVLERSSGLQGQNWPRDAAPRIRSRSGLAVSSAARCLTSSTAVWRALPVRLLSN